MEYVRGGYAGGRCRMEVDYSTCIGVLFCVLQFMLLIVSFCVFEMLAKLRTYE